MTDFEQCPVCGKTLPEGLLANFCPFCGVSFVEPGGQEPIPETSAEEKEVSWEDGHGLTFVQRLTQTWSESVFHPQDFFRRMPVRGGAGKALLYAFIFLVMGQAFTVFWQKYLVVNFQERIGEFSPVLQNLIHPSFGTQMIYGPILGLLGLLLVTIIYHLFLALIGAAKNGMEATFRVVAYSEGTLLFYIIPFFGWFIGWIWGIALMVIGFREVHETTTAKAVLAIFLPILLFWGFLAMLVIFFGTLLMRISPQGV